MTLGAGVDPALAILLFLLLAVLLTVPRMLARRSTVLPDQRPDPASRQVREIEKIALQLEELNREVGGRLDAKIRILNRLLAEAEGKITELKRLVEETR